MHRASIIVFCALLGACAGSLPEMRPSSSGFAGGGSVTHPLEDGKRHLVAGRNGLAIRRFGEELGRHPRSADALNGIAVAYARLGRYHVAHTYFERALELDPRDAATLNNYGRALLDQGRLRDARPFLEQALRYAGESDVPVIAENILTIGNAAPPSVLTARRNREQTQVGPRLLRVAADRYQLRTTIMPAGGPPTAAGLLDQRMAPPPIGDVPVPPLPQARSNLWQDRPPAAALLVDPPVPRVKPVWLPSVAGGGEPPFAPAARSIPGSPEELATIRSLIERRIMSTGFDEVLDDVFAAPAGGAGAFPIDQGEWT